MQRQHFIAAALIVAATCACVAVRDQRQPSPLDPPTPPGAGGDPGGANGAAAAATGAPFVPLADDDVLWRALRARLEAQGAHIGTATNGPASRAGAFPAGCERRYSATSAFIGDSGEPGPGGTEVHFTLRARAGENGGDNFELVDGGERMAFGPGSRSSVLPPRGRATVELALQDGVWSERRGPTELWNASRVKLAPFFPASPASPSATPASRGWDLVDASWESAFRVEVERGTKPPPLVELDKSGPRSQRAQSVARARFSWGSRAGTIVEIHASRDLREDDGAGEAGPGTSVVLRGLVAQLDDHTPLAATVQETRTGLWPDFTSDEDPPAKVLHVARHRFELALIAGCAGEPVLSEPPWLTNDERVDAQIDLFARATRKQDAPAFLALLDVSLRRAQGDDVLTRVWSRHVERWPSIDPAEVFAATEVPGAPVVDGVFFRQAMNVAAGRVVVGANKPMRIYGAWGVTFVDGTPRFTSIGLDRDAARVGAFRVFELSTQRAYSPVDDPAALVIRANVEKEWNHRFIDDWTTDVQLADRVTTCLKGSSRGRSSVRFIVGDKGAAPKLIGTIGGGGDCLVRALLDAAREKPLPSLLRNVVVDLEAAPMPTWGEAEREEQRLRELEELVKRAQELGVLEE